MFLDFKKWVKSIQTAGYNGARTVYTWGQRYEKFITSLQFANNRIAEGALFAPLLSWVINEWCHRNQ
jgi:hypothetical protein